MKTRNWWSIAALTLLVLAGLVLALGWALALAGWLGTAAVTTAVLATIE